MLFLFFILELVSCIHLNPIPSTLSPPNMLLRYSAVYDEVGTQILTIGGSDPTTFKNLKSIISFNLTTLKFKTITLMSKMNFEEISGNQLFMRKDRIIFSFGFSPGCNSLNPENYEWRTESLGGDPFPALVDFSSVSYEKEGIQYVAIFGGVSVEYLSNNLYM